MPAGALPDQYDRADGVYNLSRSALMAISMAQGKLENLRIAAQDRLHQPYRLGLIPGAEQVFDFFNKQQAYTAYISGARLHPDGTGPDGADGLHLSGSPRLSGCAGLARLEGAGASPWGRCRIVTDKEGR